MFVCEHVCVPTQLSLVVQGSPASFIDFVDLCDLITPVIIYYGGKLSDILFIFFFLIP